MTLASTEAQRGVFDSAGEAVHDHRIPLPVDDVLELADQAHEPRGREPTLEDRELHPLAVLRAELGDAPEPRRPSAFRVGDVVGDEMSIASRQHERGVCWQVAAQVAGKQRRLDRGQRPSPDRATENPMIDLGFLVRLPLLDQTVSAVVAQIDATPRHVNEVVGRDLPAANQCHDEPVGQGAQLLGKVEGERRAACSRAMEEPHLEVEADALRGADALRHEQAVAVMAENSRPLDATAWPTARK